MLSAAKPINAVIRTRFLTIKGRQVTRVPRSRSGGSLLSKKRSLSTDSRSASDSGSSPESKALLLYAGRLGKKHHLVTFDVFLRADFKYNFLIPRPLMLSVVSEIRK